jgi:hypothetical protein
MIPVRTRIMVPSRIPRDACRCPTCIDGAQLVPFRNNDKAVENQQRSRESSFATYPDGVVKRQEQLTPVPTEGAVPAVAVDVAASAETETRLVDFFQDYELSGSDDDV